MCKTTVFRFLRICVFWPRTNLYAKSFVNVLYAITYICLIFYWYCAYFVATLTQRPIKFSKDDKSDFPFTTHGKSRSFHHYHHFLYVYYIIVRCFVMVLFDLKFGWKREGIKKRRKEKETCKKLDISYFTISFYLDHFFEIFWIIFMPDRFFLSF